MDAAIDNGFQFLPGENAEIIISRYVELSVLHCLNTDVFTPYAIAFQVFSDLKLADPGARHAAAAQVWMFDLNILERIRAAKARGTLAKFDTSKEAMLARNLQIADDLKVSPKERLLAIKQACELMGYDAPVKQEITTNGQSDMLANMAKLFPQ